jgi:hypothetical protein
VLSREQHERDTLDVDLASTREATSLIRDKMAGVDKRV